MKAKDAKSHIKVAMKDAFLKLKTVVENSTTEEPTDAELEIILEVVVDFIADTAIIIRDMSP